jgi:hypothetical protein
MGFGGFVSENAFCYEMIRRSSGALFCGPPHAAVFPLWVLEVAFVYWESERLEHNLLHCAFLQPAVPLHSAV